MATLGTVSYGLQLNGVRSFLAASRRAAGGADSINKSLVALTAASAAAGLGLKALADSAGKFQEGLAAIGAVTKATASDMALLKNAAIEAGVATQFSPDQAVNGLMSLATAGQTATQAAKTLIPVLNLTAGSLGQLTTAEAGMAVVGTLNTYGMQANRAAEVTDKLLRITQMTNFQTRDFSAGLAKAAAKSNVFGQSLDDTLVVMGLLRNANIDASSAATAYTMAVQRVATDTKALNTLQKLGVSLYDKNTGKTRGFMDLITDLTPKMKMLGDATRNKALKDMFGARAIAAYNAIANAQVTVTREGQQVVLRGADAIAHLRNQMSQASGVSEEFTDALLNTYEGQKKLLSGSLDTLKIVAGEQFANAFKPFVQNTVQGINEVLTWLRQMPAETKQALAESITGWVALAAKIAAAGVAIKLLAGPLGRIVALMRSLGAAMATVRAVGFGTAATQWAAAAGPLATKLGIVARALISVKAGAIGAAVAIGFAAKKSMDSMRKIKAESAYIEAGASGATQTAQMALGFRRGKYGRTAEGGMTGVGQIEQRFGSYRKQQFRGTGLSTRVTQEQMDDPKQLDDLIKRYGSLIKQYKEAKTTQAKGFQVAIVEEGKVVDIREIGIDKIRGMYFRLIEAKEATQEGAQAAADMNHEIAAAEESARKLTAALSGGGGGGGGAAMQGWSEEEMRARAGRKQFEDEVAKIRANRAAEHHDARMRFLEEQRARQLEMMDILDAREKKRQDAAKKAAKEASRRSASAKSLQREQAAYESQQEVQSNQRVQAGFAAVGSAAQGNVGATIGNVAAAMGSAFGPVVSGALGLVDTFAGMSEAGRAFKAKFASLVGRIATALEPLFEVLSVVLGIVMDMFEPIFVWLGMQFAALGVMVLNVVIVLRGAYLEVLHFINWITGGLAGLGDAIEDLEEAQDSTVHQRNEMMKSIFKAKEATDEQTAATKKATQSMLNVPQGIKVAQARFAATNVAGGGMSRQFNDFVQRPGQAPTNFSPADTIIGVKDPSDIGGQGTIILQNVHINANDPTAFFRNLLSLVNRDHKRGGQALGGMYQGRP